MEHVAILRAELKRQNLDGFIIPSSDEFQGEYVPACARRLEWLTHFSGSAGLAIVLKSKAAFFTDGRYTLQARNEIAKGFVVHNIANISPAEWLENHANADDRIAFDPWLFTEQSIQRYMAAAAKRSCRMVPTENLIDRVWKHRPKPPRSHVVSHPIRYSGWESAGKREAVAEAMIEAGAEYMVLTAPDSICWLLNIRGEDVPHNPFILAHAIIDKEGAVEWFIDAKRVSASVKRHLGKGVTLRSPSELNDALFDLRGRKVMLDPSQAAHGFFAALTRAGADIVNKTDPCQLMKARKNKVEVNGAKAAHIRDGRAVVKLLAWLDANVKKGKLTEISVADRLESFRKESKELRDLSFDTIAGFGGNGAIVHYRATNKTNASIKGNGLLLLDSGGQYPDGTTDITRTVAIGQPTAEQKKNFTRVLKGHIALASAKFPKGTSGAQLDALARMPLWHHGLDFDHGTGHGVGSYLSVHEGPQRISRVSHVPLEPGMILSNEPGYYEAGKYGIRIENLVVVKESKEKHTFRTYYEFETITMVPLDRKLIDLTLLTKEEVKWLNDYHKKVAQKLGGNGLSAYEREWLARATVPLA